MSPLKICFAAGVFAAVSVPAAAATLTSYVSKEGKVIVILNGEIASGDADQLTQLTKSANDSGKIVSGIRLNSPGGNLLEGVKLSELIRFAKIATVVPNGSTCASACFVAFAAGADKFASYSASVGVHGASDKNGRETEQGNAATVAMAKVVKELGVPAEIIGRMVVTPPDQIVWLSPNNLRAMGTTMTGKPVQTPSANAAQVAAPAQVPVQPPAQTEQQKWEKHCEMGDRSVDRTAQRKTELRSLMSTRAENLHDGYLVHQQ
ncbi:MAG: ATP-dependent Clp protease proteolytic subunit [Methylocella sp.]